MSKFRRVKAMEGENGRPRRLIAQQAMDTLLLKDLCGETLKDCGRRVAAGAA